MNMFKGLLFLHGHFTRPEDLEDTPAAARTEYGARTAAAELFLPLGNRTASAAWFGRHAGKPRVFSTTAVSHKHDITPAPDAPSRLQANLLTRLLYLGGRPMHAGHNFDVDEPLGRWEGADNRAGPERRRNEHRARSAIAQTQTCIG